MTFTTKLNQMKEQPIASSARRRSQRILGDILWPMHRQALRSVLRKDEAHVVDISCGSGRSSIGLLHLLGKKSLLSAYDIDPVNIDTVTTLADCITVDPQFAFLNGQFEDSEITESVDCVFGSAILNTYERNTSIIEHASKCLKPGGVLILSFIDFSRIYGFPRIFALDRYVEYMHLFQDALGMSFTSTTIERLCDDQRFSQVSLSTSKPHFLDEDQRSLPSLILEYASQFIVDLGLGSGIELDAVIGELRQLSEKHGTMISQPVIYQLSAVRA